MIKIFFSLSGYRSIRDADRIPEIIAKQLFYFLRIFFQKGTAECIQFRTVISCGFSEPFTDLSDKKFSCFLIGNNESVSVISAGSMLCQIACCKKNTPQVFDAVIQFAVCQFLTDFFYNFFSCYQLFDLITGLHICFVDKTPYNCISTCIGPVIFWLCGWICTQLIAVADHIPRAVNIRFSKAIAIIPSLYIFIMFCRLCIRMPSDIA